METSQSDPSIIATPTNAQLPEQKNSRSFRLLLAGCAFALLAVMAGLFWYLSASSDKPVESTGISAEGAKVKIGHSQWIGYVPLLVALDQGFFEAEGVEVELVMYDSLAKASEDYNSGELQGYANLGLDALKDAENGLDHKIVMLIDNSFGSDGIIARPGIASMADVKGKKVAYEFGTLEEFFLRYALEEVGLTLADVEGVNLNPEAAAEALMRQEVDVAVTYEPFMTNALYTVGGNKIYSSKDAPHLISDVLTFHSDFIEQHPASIEAIVRAYFKAIDFNKSNPLVAQKILAEAYSISIDDVILQLEGVKIADQAANRAAFTKDSGPQSLYSNLQEIAKFVQATNNETEVFDTATIIDPSFVQNILTEQN